MGSDQSSEAGAQEEQAAAPPLAVLSEHERQQLRAVLTAIVAASDAGGSQHRGGEIVPGALATHLATTDSIGSAACGRVAAAAAARSDHELLEPR